MAQEEIENLNKHKTCKETESVVKNHPPEKSQDRMASLVNAAKHLQKDEYQSSNHSKKLKKQQHFVIHSLRPAGTKAR
jgi:hypothetical protein